MRLAGQMKLGYYPAHVDAVRLICRHLKMKDGGAETYLLDPCAGEGVAVGEIAHRTMIALDKVYAVELDTTRAEKCRAELGPWAKVLGPAGFLGSRITGESFGLAYVNPPFDDEMGGGRREEYAFAEMATWKLVSQGILVLVMPESAIAKNMSFKEFLDGYYADAALYRWPEAHRHYNEVVFIGRKRSRPVPQRHDSFLYSTRFGAYADPLPLLGSDDRVWECPPGKAPRRFEKVSMTEADMIEAVESSRLLSIFDPPPEVEIDRPPLPPYTGHVAQLLAAGMLNGVVSPPDETPHVVRGTATKQDVMDAREALLNEDGDKIGEREVWIQIITLTVRALGLDGLIRTFLSSGQVQPKP